MRRRISIWGCVRPSVGPSVGPSACPVLFSKVKRTHTRRILCRVSGLVRLAVRREGGLGWAGKLSITLPKLVQCNVSVRFSWFCQRCSMRDCSKNWNEMKDIYCTGWTTDTKGRYGFNKKFNPFPPDCESMLRSSVYQTDEDETQTFSSILLIFFIKIKNFFFFI